MTAPSIGTFEDAANASFWTGSATAWGLTQMDGADDAPLQVATANGCTAAAFVDDAGQVIVTFEGTETAQQSAADAELMDGEPGALIPAFQDAVSFTLSVEQAAATKGIQAADIYVTGHSLGGALAEYAALQTGLGGVSFAGAGIPGYVAPSTPAVDFISYVERGDAFANWASDGSERALVTPGTTQDHYGQVVTLGAPSQDALTDTIIADYQALVPAMFTGQLSQAAAKLAADFENNLLTIHGMRVYAADIAALPPLTLASAVAKISADPSLLLSSFTHAARSAVHAPEFPSTSAVAGLEHLVAALGAAHASPVLLKT